MQQKPEPSDIVEPVVPPGVGYPQYPQYPPPQQEKASGGWKELLKAIIPAAIVFVYVFINSGNYITVAQNTKNLQAITASVTDLSNRLKGDEGTITTLSTQITGMTQQLQSFQTSMTSLTNTVSSHSSQLNSIPTKSQIDTLQSQLTAMSSKVDSLPTTIKADYTAQITALQSNLDKLNKSVTDITNSLNTTTNTGGTSSSPVPSGQVATNIVGNPFTGSQVMAFSQMTSGQVQSQTFSFTLTNNTGKQINNIQLAVGLELLDTSNNVLVSGVQNVTFVLSSSTTMTAWTAQNTGIAYILGFTNGAPTGIFGSIGALNQGAGTSTYQITIMATSTAPSGTNTVAFNVLPVVKVVSYN